MDSNKIKKGLGRGLSSLIGETKVESQKNQLSINSMIHILFCYNDFIPIFNMFLR